MKHSYIKIKSIAALALAAALTISLCACDNGSASSSAESTPTETSQQSNSTVQESSNNSSDNSDSENSSAAEEYEYVKNGIFSLPNGKLAFTLAEEWELTSSKIAYQFASENSQNRFNLVVSAASSDITEVTAEEMTSTYETTMEDFNLITFEHTAINDKPAIYMQLSGRLSQVATQTIIYQYMIQSGTDAYCFSFTQTSYDDGFTEMMSDLIDSLIIS